MCSRDAAASLRTEGLPVPTPPALSALPGGMPGWLAEPDYVAALALERFDTLADLDFWLTLPTVALLLDALAASPDMQMEVARRAFRYAGRLVDELPRPLNGRAVYDGTMLGVLPPFLPLSPSNPFVVALQSHGLALVAAFVGAPDASALTVTVDRIRSRLGTYCLAAGLGPHLRANPHLRPVPPPDGAA